MTFTLILVVWSFKAGLTLFLGTPGTTRSTDDSRFFLWLIYLVVIIIIHVLIPMYWILKNEKLKEYAMSLLPTISFSSEVTVMY